jgi:hypothetical protein
MTDRRTHPETQGPHQQGGSNLRQRQSSWRVWRRRRRGRRTDRDGNRSRRCRRTTEATSRSHGHHQRSDNVVVGKRDAGIVLTEKSLVRTGRGRDAEGAGWSTVVLPSAPVAGDGAGRVIRRGILELQLYICHFLSSVMSIDLVQSHPPGRIGFFSRVGRRTWWRVRMHELPQKTAPSRRRIGPR